MCECSLSSHQQLVQLLNTPAWTNARRCRRSYCSRPRDKLCVLFQPTSHALTCRQHWSFAFEQHHIHPDMDQYSFARRSRDKRTWHYDRYNTPSMRYQLLLLSFFLPRARFCVAGETLD